MVVADEEQFRSLPASIATARAYLAQALGDIPSTVAHARRALDLLPKEDHVRHGQVASLLGLAYWATGDLEAALRTVADAMDRLLKAGNLVFAISTTFVLAYIREAQGRLNEARRTYERSLQLAAELSEAETQVRATLYLGLSEVLYEQNDQQTAAQYLLASKELGEQAAFSDWPHRRCLAEARVKEAQGDLDGAHDLLDKAERLFFRSAIPDVRPIAALKTRVWTKQGRLAEAMEWARECGLSVDDDLCYLREFEHITLAKVLVARYKSERVDRFVQEAERLLERLLRAAKEGGRTGSAIEILALQALACYAQGDLSRALPSLEHALTLAEPEGYVRIFVDEGPPMAALLREAAQQSIAPIFVRRLRAAFGKTIAFPKATALGTAAGKTPVTQALSEPLTKRELQVLGLLRTELSGPEIARELVVSLNTIRTHTKNIYSKLEVNSREAAVRRAEELDLL
jgi:LuxR family maltose regulon positive regulatory protein